MSNEEEETVAYEKDGKVVYRASAIGGCLVALAAARQGLEAKPPTDGMQEIFNAGHDTEDSFNAAFPEVLTNRQMEVRLPVTSRIEVVGHIDGLHQEAIGEVKSQSDEEWGKWSQESWISNPLWVKYGWQVSCYMLGTGRELAVFRVKRSNPEVFEVYHITRPFHTLDEIRERVLEAEMLAAEDVLQCSKPSFPCPYYYLHIEGEMVDEKELDEAIEDYLRAGEDAKFCEEIRREAKKVMERYFEKYVSGKIVTGKGVKVSRSEYDKKEVVIPARHEVRITVTPPKGA